MSNKAAIDFGNSNTVLAVWNDQSTQADVLYLPEFSQAGSFLIPSLIAYEPDGRFLIGDQTGCKASPDAKTFRWMKRYIGLRSPYSLKIGEIRIDAYRAAEDFLRSLFSTAFPNTGNYPDEIIMSVPVESFEHYSDWLMTGMHNFAGLPLRLIDEATAAAAGYGLNLHPDDKLLVVDFGGSTLQASCVSVIEEGIRKGRCCRVLGKSGRSLGGMSLDRWIYEEALSRLGFSENDPRIRCCCGDLLRYCEHFKMKLSVNEQADFDFFPDRSFMMTATELKDLFSGHGLFETITSAIEETLRSAEDRGLIRSELTVILPVGGSCLIPSVREHLESLFPTEKIITGEPLSAVARGAAVIAGGMHIYDFIQHDYAIRYTDPETGEYAFRTIIAKGTKYPADHVTKPMKLKASYEGQLQFGIAVYELRDITPQETAEKEIFFDTDGSARLMQLTEEEKRSEKFFWMNERNPLFLKTDGPAQPGIPRFTVTFGIDSNKMLTINANDIITGRQVLSNHPVVRLV